MPLRLINTFVVTPPSIFYIHEGENEAKNVNFITSTRTMSHHVKP